MPYRFQFICSSRWGINRLSKERDTDSMETGGYLRCPTENGGCGQLAAWAVKIERDDRRLILDCTQCGYRVSLPLDVVLLTTRFTGPLDESGAVPLETGRG